MSNYKRNSMRSFFFHFLMMVFGLGCKKNEVKEEYPDCLNSIIDSHKINACSSGASVKEYSFQNNLVFVFDPGICGADMQSIVYNNTCINIGALGGIAGNTTINGADFSMATYVKTIWQN